MKIYNGWVLNIYGKEATVIGSNKIRGCQRYLLSTSEGTKTIKRTELLECMNDGSIKYITSVVLN